MGDVFGVRPWEMERMRIGELDACKRYLENERSRGT